MIKWLSVPLVMILIVGSYQQTINPLHKGRYGRAIIRKPVVRRYCWTDWFDRDNPSGTGDWETIRDLRREKPGKICDNPVRIEAQTTAGQTVASTGNVIYKTDTTTGFVCRNSDQKRGRCRDYRVRFLCPSAFCNPGCWTDWFDRDNPSGTGDWETIRDLRREKPGKICDNPVQIEAQTTAGQTVASTGNVIYKTDTATGFVCRNSDQKRGRCRDYRVRFLCPSAFCNPGCWTDWFDRDNPSGTGDWETIRDLRREKPGKICDNPVQIEAQTTAGQTVASTGNVIYKTDTATGFVCRNSDQKRGRCRDYRVRFLCPSAFCNPGCWTDWFDRDNPSGTGDWETIRDLRREKPGKICDNPVQIEAQTTAGQTVASTGNVIYKTDTATGFVCRNSDQKRGRCRDYRVRFLCPSAFCNPGCWTDWFDRDNPSGTGDWETIRDLRREKPGKICDNPVQIEAQTTAGQTVASTGNVIYKTDTATGFVCRNSDQKRGRCRDYRVRFLCPSAFCNPGCWTDWFDRDNPSGTGDWETIRDLRREKPGKICDNPVQIEAQTTAGQTVASTGNVIYKTDTATGFVCRNSDQKRGRCRDYRVRFLCPSAFCNPGCWTDWFDRDNPSGTGDWETIRDLRREKPGKICDNPVQIEAQTTAGQTVASTGNVIYKTDTATGFVCRNSDQKRGRCRDYRVRFLCPSAFCNPGCWTDWFDRDNPSGTGDWETIRDLRREKPGKICDNPVQIEAQTTAGQTVASTGNVIYKTDTATGFVCRNSDQKRGRCRDYRVRFLCPSAFCNPGCWTDWFDRDNPSGTGDWETIRDLRREKPGKICDNPVQIEAQTTAGKTVASTGNVIYKTDTATGFVCRNSDQKRGRCRDYRVRFLCPSAFCNPGCWTDWFDRDNPSGTGDWETIRDLRREKPGKICDNPVQIEAQTTAGQTVASTGNVIYKTDTATGFVCRNSDQKQGRCRDYRVRFLCPSAFCNPGGNTPAPTTLLSTQSPSSPECWTDWFDRDNPSGTGDWEMLNSLRKERTGKICDNPVRIEAQTTAGQTVASTGNVIYKTDTATGFVCRNSDQKRGRCRDYRVRYLCPPAFCNPGGNTPAPTTLLSTRSPSSPECWTDWFDRDNPSGTGDWEMLNSLRKERPGKICDNPVRIEAQTTAGQTVASTGNVIYKIDTATGFVCRNSDQKRGRCRDYRVRYLCPPAFCNPSGNTPAPTTLLSTQNSSSPGCWTDWFDRDNPSGTGDWETLLNLRRERPGTICDCPVWIEVQTTAGQTVASTGNVIYQSSPTEGFVCRNQDQKRGLCQDYKVRFGCPCQYNKTGHCSASNPTVFLFLSSLYMTVFVCS